MKTHRILLDPAAPAGGNGNPPAPSAPPAGFISEAQHTAALEKARTEEKTKLQSEITRLVEESKLSQNTLAEQKRLLSELEGKYNTLAATVKTAGDSPIDVSKLIEEVSAKAREAAALAFNSQIESVRSEAQGATKQLRSMTLNQFKAQEIKAAGGENVLVMELVGGDSEEAIKASVAQAKSAYERIRAGVTVSANNGGSTPPTAPPALPSPNNGTGSNGGQLPEVKAMSVKDFAAQRQELLKKTAGRYQGQG